MLGFYLLEFFKMYYSSTLLVNGNMMKTWADAHSLPVMWKN